VLGLKLRTDPRWVRLVESNLEEILTDHAWCEQKAAINAMNLVAQNPERSDLVADMLAIAQEELAHFEQVHAILRARGFVLGRDRKDEYVNDLLRFLKKDGSRQQSFIDRLLFAALIEARSCERFRVLSEHIRDPELAKFYKDLMVSEANHFTVFLNYARQYEKSEVVDKRWSEWLAYEDSVIVRYGKKETVHG
jgi:tRNA 2-(methylsulfanyl)-N6-isopentenyladenosine37 hydroxylase